MSFNICTSQAIIRKAGANASATATASSALLADYCDQAESTICMRTRKDWITDWANVDTNIKPSVSEAVAAIAAMSIINYDMSGYTSRAEAQTMLDVLNNEASQIIKDLKDKNFQRFDK